MQALKTLDNTFERPLVTAVGIPLLVVLIGLTEIFFAQQPSPKMFPSPEAASRALFQAVKTYDESGVRQILGAREDQLTSGDKEEDRIERDHFIEKYREMHRLVKEQEGATILYIGSENWPFPFPLILKNGAWQFDSRTGTKEILFRRIGENEISAIEACHALVRTAREQDTNQKSGDLANKYPHVFVSAGLANSDEFNADQPQRPVPFQGYYFRLIRGKAGNAGDENESGASNARTSRGFAFVAYPAEYRLTGVLTFIVNQDNLVYEKDLGLNTEKLAKSITQYKPDETWHSTSH